MGIRFVVDFTRTQNTFLLKAPTKKSGSINLYAYTQGNPLRYLDYSGHECIGEKDYFQRTAEMLLIGNFSDEFTGAGLAIQIILGIFGVDLLFDIRDLAADLTVNFEPSSSEWWVQIGLGIVAFLPAIGLLKFSDELTTGAKGGWKSLIKNTDEMAEGAKKAAKNSAEIIQAGKRNTDDIIKQINQLTQEAGEKADDVLTDLKKAENGTDAVDDVIEGA